MISAKCDWRSFTFGRIITFPPRNSHYAFSKEISGLTPIINILAFILRRTGLTKISFNDLWVLKEFSKCKFICELTRFKIKQLNRVVFKANKQLQLAATFKYHLLLNQIREVGHWFLLIIVLKLRLLHLLQLLLRNQLLFIIVIQPFH